MNDRAFLIWLHARLEIYGENPLVDYMHKLRAIIHATPKDKLTPNVVCCNSLAELEAELEAPNPCTNLKSGEYQVVANADGSVNIHLGRDGVSC